MIAVDTTILVFAHRRETTLHELALDAIRELAEGPDIWAIPWPCIHEFYATVTTSKYKPSSTTKQAWAMVQSLVGLPNLRLLSEGFDHLRYLQQLSDGGRVMGGAIHDARVAAICLAHGVNELWTADRDFVRFSELRTHNPLQ